MNGEFDASAPTQNFATLFLFSAKTMILGAFRGNKDLLPSLAVVLGGVMWGLFWIPLREVGSDGLTGVWPGALIYSGLCLVLLPVLAVKRKTLVGINWLAFAWCGLFTGAAFTLYSISLFLTDVVRSILLFYMTPIWSTILGVLFLGERLTWNRGIALLLGLAGLLTILGVGAQIPWPKNIGDWLALIAGMTWAYGCYCMYKLEGSGVFGQLLTFSFGSLFVSVGFIIFGGVALSPPVEFRELTTAIPTAIAVIIFVLPMLLLTLWPATVLSPGRVGLLLMGEVVVGVVSAAILTNEAFGLREFVGALLIVSAGFVEVAKRSP